jgi:hypothetical protein
VKERYLSIAIAIDIAIASPPHHIPSPLDLTNTAIMVQMYTIAGKQVGSHVVRTIMHDRMHLL